MTRVTGGPRFSLCAIQHRRSEHPGINDLSQIFF